MGMNKTPARERVVRIGWQPWEIELLRGAMTEPDTRKAIADCAQMLSRSHDCVERRMGEERRAAGIFRYMQKPKVRPPVPKITMPVRLEAHAVPEPVKPAAVIVSDFIRPLTREMLMGARAPYRQKFAVA